MGDTIGDTYALYQLHKRMHIKIREKSLRGSWKIAVMSPGVNQEKRGSDERTIPNCVIPVSYRLTGALGFNINQTITR